MNPKLARLLTRLYPRSWRARYGSEFEAYLQNSHGGVRACANVVVSAVREHLVPAVGSDANQGWVQVCCARAPWAVFVLVPLLLMALAYLAACAYLWLGWQIFLPGASTPFGHGGGPVYGVRNLYFQAGKFFYFGVPILAFWLTAVLAVRQKVKPIWPILGLGFITWMGCAAHIDAGQTAVPWAKHVTMSFPVASSLHDLHQDPSHAAAILVLTFLPFVAWRLQTKRSSFM